MVLENIFRHAESGEDRVTAAREGTREIAFAALAATLAVCAIFIPVVFMKGIVGKFFLQFGVTLCVAVLLSYLEAVTLAPARCSQILDVSRERRSRLGRAVDEAFTAPRQALLAGAALGAAPPGPGDRRQLPALRPGDRRLPRHAEGDGAVAGPVAGHDPPHRRRRLRSRRDRPAGAPRRGVPALPPRRAARLRGGRRLRRRRRQHRGLLRHPRAAGRAHGDAGAVQLRSPQGAQLLPRPARRRPGPLAAGLHRPARLPGRVLGARLGLEPVDRQPARS